MVAKSYQELKMISEEPYAKANGRLYVKVLTKNGSEREVRWYNAEEYAKMYPGESVDPKMSFNQKNMLGFQKGYITIFKGNQEKYEDWFDNSIARYCRHWGWYVVSADTIPFDLPTGLEPVELKWEMVGCGTDLKNDAAVRAAVQSLLSGSHPSTFQGKTDERVELTLTVIKSEQTENYFGKKAHHLFEDEYGNRYVWDTAAKFWAEGSVKRVRATIKEHKVINNIQTTVLTRCMEQ